MRIIIIIIITNEKKKICAEKKNGIWLLPKLCCNTTIALQAAGQAGAHRRGRAGQASAGRWVSGCRALGRVTRRHVAGGRTRGARGRGALQGRTAGAREARGRGARGARHELQASGRVSGDTAEGLLRHGASARSARGLARPGRGLVRWLGQLGAHAASLGFDLGF